MGEGGAWLSKVLEKTEREGDERKLEIIGGHAISAYSRPLRSTPNE
jgi:hypothetical protein